MGSFFSKILQILFGDEERKILMLGLDSAGKTTILYKLKLDEAVTTIPTIGFNVEEIKYKNIVFQVWDIGGQFKIRILWKYYYQGRDAVIFVVNSLDRERIGEANEILHNILANEQLIGIPLLVFANKQDNSCAMDIPELTNKLDLNSISGRNWYIVATCAITGEGIYEGLDWIKSILPKKY